MPSTPAQLSFADLGQSRPTDRLFFAIFPDPAAREAIVRVADEVGARHGLRGKGVAPDRLHVTLHHLGDFAGLPQAVLDAAERAATQLEEPCFDIVFDRVGSFAAREQKPCVLLAAQGDTPVQRFQRALGDRLIANGQSAAVKRSFIPHVTLRYNRILLPTEAVAVIGWNVRELFLVHSLIGKSEYRELGRWPLRS
jgi:2'-5' RNA ligase